MKNLTILLTLIIIGIIGQSQNPGLVLDYQKISDTEGNFSGILNDNDSFGKTAVIGDLNNDGVDDLAVGSPLVNDGGTEKGAVWILFMNSDGTVNSSQKISDTEGNFTGILSTQDRFGCAVAAIGDLDDDGIEDLAVGAYYDNDAGTNTGAVYILFLNTNGTVKNYQKISGTQGGISGLTANRFFGIGISCVGDLDGDSIVEIAVGAPQYDNDGGLYKGCVWILFLKANGTVKAQQIINDYQGGFGVSLDDRDYFGYGVHPIGDIDNDGLQDIAVTAVYDDDGGTDVGAFYIICLNSNGTVKSQQKISSTTGNFNATLSDNDRFGMHVDMVGDINGDGINDLMTSAPKDDDGGTDRGCGYVLFMNANRTVNSYQKISNLSGNFTAVLEDGDMFGSDITCLGDMDSDGHIEVAVSAVKDDDGGTDRGAIYILTLQTIPNGINENSVLHDITIYPNPADNIINIESGEEVGIKMYNSIGQEMPVNAVFDGSHYMLNIAGMQKGIYFIDISDGIYTLSKKVIIQ